MSASTTDQVLSARLAEKNKDFIVLEIPHTHYRLRLIPRGEITAQPGQRIRGRIEANARRIDLCRTGGTFIDPVYGRPRTIQGRVICNSSGPNILVVDASIPIHVRVRPPQTPGDFAEGDLVTFAIDPGVMFTPIDR